MRCGRKKQHKYTDGGKASIKAFYVGMREYDESIDN